jgi:hypothetical protein
MAARQVVGVIFAWALKLQLAGAKLNLLIKSRGVQFAASLKICPPPRPLASGRRRSSRRVSHSTIIYSCTWFSRGWFLWARGVRGGPR